jgi:hypothetical protein
MGEFLDQIPDNIKGHIQQIAKDIKLDDDEDAVEKVAKGWLDKKEAFEEKIESMGMEEVDSLVKDDEKGALALTYSGSLVNIGPVIDGVRHSTYTSIGFRTNAPDQAESDNSTLDEDIEVDGIIKFSNGPVKSTSRIFKVAVCKDDDLSAEEQEKTIMEVATVIEDEFVEVNKTIMMD